MEDRKTEMPIGLAFNMAMNEDAMERFANMTEAEKKEVEARSRQVHSKADMEQLVDELAKGTIQSCIVPNCTVRMKT